MHVSKFAYSAGYKLGSDDYIDANIRLALSAATEASHPPRPITYMIAATILVLQAMLLSNYR